MIRRAKKVRFYDPPKAPKGKAGPHSPRARYICVAYAGPNGFLRQNWQAGTSTFHIIWNCSPTESSHIVMMFGPDRWLVTDRFAAKMSADAHVLIGPVTEFETKDAAMMAAIMMAGQESRREEFVSLCLNRYAHTRGRSKRAEAFANMYGRALQARPNDYLNQQC